MYQNSENILARLRTVLRRKHRSIKTEKNYVQWAKRFLAFCQKEETPLDRRTVESFLSDLAVKQKVSASTQNQAFSALLFLFREVFEQNLDNVDALRAKCTRRLPVVMSKQEVRLVIGQMSGPTQLIAQLLYGCGMRLNECLQLRVKDVDFAQELIVVREGKGDKDRITLLPLALMSSLRTHLQTVQQLHHVDLIQGYGAVYLPHAIERKYPKADKEWLWQYVFPSHQRSKDPRSGRIRRHHLHECTMQRALKEAVQRTGIPKRITCHTFRHSFATHLLEDGYDIRVIQELLGHDDLNTTMLYTHVLQQRKPRVLSPLDLV